MSVFRLKFHNFASKFWIVLKCRLSVKGERDFNIFQRSFSVCIRATVWKEMQYRGRGDFRGENGIFLGLRNFFLLSLMGEPTCNITSTAFKGEVGHKIDSIKGLLVTTWRFFSRTFSKLATGRRKERDGVSRSVLQRQNLFASYLPFPFSYPYRETWRCQFLRWCGEHNNRNNTTTHMTSYLKIERSDACFSCKAKALKQSLSSLLER